MHILVLLLILRWKAVDILRESYWIFDHQIFIYRFEFCIQLFPTLNLCTCCFLWTIFVMLSALISGYIICWLTSYVVCYLIMTLYWFSFRVVMYALLLDIVREVICKFCFKCNLGPINSFMLRFIYGYLTFWCYRAETIKKASGHLFPEEVIDLSIHM